MDDVEKLAKEEIATAIHESCPSYVGRPTALNMAETVMDALTASGLTVVADKELERLRAEIERSKEIAENYLDALIARKHGGIAAGQLADELCELHGLDLDERRQALTRKGGEDG